MLQADNMVMFQLHRNIVQLYNNSISMELCVQEYRTIVVIEE